jgi:hypothetical protein
MLTGAMREWRASQHVRLKLMDLMESSRGVICATSG